MYTAFKCTQKFKEITEPEIPAESLPNQLEHDHVPSELSSSIEIPKPNPATSPLSLETPAGNVSSGVHVPSDKKLPIAKQKSPVRHLPLPTSAKTFENKPVAPKAPIPTAGFGTDISSRISLSNPIKSNGLKIDNPFMPIKKVDSPLGGFLSKIISMFIGFFIKKH
jgi:hypothetical protein